jgi:hypothetical protein
MVIIVIVREMSIKSISSEYNMLYGSEELYS